MDFLYLVGNKLYKRFLSDLMTRQKEQVHYVYASLDVVLESLKNPAIKVSAKEREEILRSCMTVIKPLSNGLVGKMENRPILLKNLFEKVIAILAEKISHVPMNIDITCPEDLSFNNDSLVMELVLMTLIGKAIYRTPKNGEVTITLEVRERSIQLEIRDKGYILPNEEKLFKSVFNHFIEGEVLDAFCQENELFYRSFKNNEEVNVALLEIPISCSKQSAANINIMASKAAFLK